MRVVLDTNVLVSALLFRGPTSRFVDLWQSQQICPLVSRAIVEEYVRVLAYPKFRLTAAEIKTLIEEVVLPYFEVVRPTQRIDAVQSDPSDNKFLECAVAGEAARLISGDADLLAIKEHCGVVIEPPSEFLLLFR